MPVVLLESGTGVEIFLCHSSLLRDECIVIIRGDLWSKIGSFSILVLQTIATGCKSEVGPSDGHIDTDGSILRDIGCEFVSKSFDGGGSPRQPPEGDPSTVNLSSEEDAVIGPSRRCLDEMELYTWVATRYADMRIGPVMVLPVSERLLVVKLALDL